MQSKNKKPPTTAERKHIAKLKELNCIICDASSVEIHEPEQGLWFVSMPLCAVCHRDPQRGWHGARLNFKANKWGELQAINATIKILMESSND